MSAIGDPLVSTSLLVSWPASPLGSTRTVYPVALVNCRSTSLDIAHESWVATTTRLSALPASSDPLVTEHPATSPAQVISAVAARPVSRYIGMSPVSPVVGGRGPLARGRDSTSFVGANRIRFEGLRRSALSAPVALPCRSPPMLHALDAWVASAGAQPPAPAPDPADPGDPRSQRGARPPAGTPRRAGRPAARPGEPTATRRRPVRRATRGAGRWVGAALLRGSGAPRAAAAHGALPARGRLRVRARPLSLAVRRPAGRATWRPGCPPGLPAHTHLHLARLTSCPDGPVRAAGRRVAARSGADGRLRGRRAGIGARPAGGHAIRAPAHAPNHVRSLGRPDR